MNRYGFGMVVWNALALLVLVIFILGAALLPYICFAIGAEGLNPFAWPSWATAAWVFLQVCWTAAFFKAMAR